MAERKQYRKKRGAFVVAVQLNLDTPGLSYVKWGATQSCRARDWLLDNEGDVYTVDRETFGRTYRRVAQGVYEKITPVWAEVAVDDGAIQTKEGITHYRAGAYLVFNDRDGRDGYAVERETFERTYEPYSPDSGAADA